MTLKPIDMRARALHLHPDGSVRDDAPRTAGQPEGWHLATFHADTDADVHADTWEMHPSAEEVVCCLAGALRLILRPEQPAAEPETVRLPSGTCCVVPRGRWHRIELDEPTDLMSVTLRHGTRREPCAS